MNPDPTLAATENCPKDGVHLSYTVRRGEEEMHQDIEARALPDLLACVREYDGAEIDQLEVTREEWEEGVEAVDPADRAALGKAAMRVRDFHRRRIPSSWEMREEGGGFMGQRVRPLQQVSVPRPSRAPSSSAVP